MFLLLKKLAHAQQAGHFVKAEKPLYERIPLPDQRPPFHFHSTPPSSCLCKANSEFYGFKTFMG